MMFDWVSLSLGLDMEKASSFVVQVLATVHFYCLLSRLQAALSLQTNLEFSVES